MNLYTEKEFVVNNSFFAFKLRNLYTSDEKLFYQVSDYIPNGVYVNKRENLDYTFYNPNSLKSPETDMVSELGSQFLKEISCPLLLEVALKKIQLLKVENDYDSNCSFVQGIKMNNKTIYTYTNKLLLESDLYFNLANRLDQFGEIGKVVNSVFETQLSDLYSWQRFLSLTQQEKRIIKLLAKGESNHSIGDILFISGDTVKTHRKNIYKKLNIHNLCDVIRISITLDVM